MLRKVILYNFVCFENEISFKFEENGVHFFMGGNGTGKTTVFEAIRNCLKTADFKQTSRCDPGSDAYAICYFLEGIYKIASIYLDDVAKKKILKISMMTVEVEGKRTVQVFGARRERPTYNDWKSFKIELDGKLTQGLKRVKTQINDVFSLLEEDRTVDVISLFNNIFPELENRETETTSFDKFIDEFVSIQMTLPYRGINGGQSTFADTNQLRASSNSADVLRWCLERIDDDGRGMLLHVFRQLSNGDAHSLEIDENGEIGMQIGVNSMRKRVPLLRLPEAVVEGHVTLLMLCGATPSTLCLDEPNRGMDMQTTKLLCNILKHITDRLKKLVIVATHDPYFISHWNLPKSYIFRWKGDECRVFSGKGLLDMKSGEIKEKVKTTITSYPMSLIWFSKKVFIVEGLSDLMFVRAIQHVIVQDLNNIGRTLLEWAGLRADPFLHLLQEFLSSLTIISIGGEGSKTNAEIVCTFLEMKSYHNEQPCSRYYLFDRDAYGKINKKLNLNFKTDKPSFTELAESGVFIWSADLEREVALFCHAKNLKKLLTKNNVPVTDDVPFRIKRVKDTRGCKPGKLFLESSEITEVNVHNIVAGILSVIHLGKERRTEGGTVPMFLKFIIIAMLKSIGQGNELKWDGEDFRVSTPITQNANA